MWVRIAVHYPIWFEPEPLAVYRQHNDSSTWRKILTGENVRDIRRCIEITSRYFPPEIGTSVRTGAGQHYAQWCINNYGRKLLVEGQREGGVEASQGMLGIVAESPSSCSYSHC